MSPKTINFKPRHVSSLGVLLAMGLISLPLAGVAQNNYKSSGYISQELNSTVKQSRQAGTEILLRQTALQLLDLPETIASDQNSFDTLKPSAPGVRPANTEYLHPDKLRLNYGFFYLPTALGKPKDANGIALAYCPFNFPEKSASETRLRGSDQTPSSGAKDAIGFAIISAGANGRFDLSCERFRNIKKGEMNNETDDLYVIQSFHDITYAGANSRYVEKSVETYDDLLKIDKQFSYDGQIRWVKKTNQFFRYDLFTEKWKPLNAGFQPNTAATADATQIELNWLSGSMGVGTAKQANSIKEKDDRAILTLGTQQQDKGGNVSINPNYLAGIGFNDTNDALFAYIGLLDDNTFSLRRGNDNRITLDKDGNLTFFGTKITVKGPTTFENELTANGGLKATTGTFSGPLKADGGLTATDGTFTGKLSAGSISTTGDLFSGPLSATTGSFSEPLKANGGLSATTGNFSGLLTGTEGTFTGNLSATGVLSGGSITTGGSLSAGSISTSGDLSATTGSFSGPLNANGGLNATTGNFSGPLNANGGLTVSGNAEINGDLILKGKLITGNVTTLKFFAPSVGNSDLTEIGSAQFTSTTGLQNVNLTYANKFFESINQKLGTVDTPVFTGLKVGTFNSDGTPVSLGTIQGNLQGTAERLNQTLTLEVKQLVTVNNSGNLETKDLGTSTATFNLKDAGDKSQTITLSGYLDQRDQRSVNINNPSFSAAANINCYINGSTAQACDQTTITVGGNVSANFSGSSSSYTNTLGSGGDLSILAAKVAALESSGITISLTGDILSNNSQSVTARLGQTASLSLNTASNLNYAKNMDQDVKKDSTVTFAGLTVPGDGSGTFGKISTNTLTVTGTAVIQSSLQMNSNSGTPTISINGQEKTINFINGGGKVTAETFVGNLNGNADTATKLKNPIQLTVTGDLVGNSSTSDNINYNLNLTLANNTISTAKLQDFAITNSKIADNAVSTSKLQDLAISTSKIQDAAITTGKLADNAISTAKLQEFAVTTAKIANGNITTEKLASGATIDNARALISPSDVRLKEGITTIEGLSLLERLSKINLFGYSFRDDPMHNRTLGVLAQELQPLFPELVSVQTEGKHTGYYAVNYGLMGALASAGVGHLNKKLDSLGLQVKDPRTLSANLPNFTVSNISAQRIETQKLKAREIEAGKGNFEDLSSDKFSATNGKAVRMQADTINSGQAEGYAGLGSALPLFGGGMEGHYIVNVSSPDGSYATASVFVSGGQIHVVPMATQNISIVPSMGMVHAVANGKVLKATWLKTG